MQREAAEFIINGAEITAPAMFVGDQTPREVTYVLKYLTLGCVLMLLWVYLVGIKGIIPFTYLISGDPHESATVVHLFTLFILLMLMIAIIAATNTATLRRRRFAGYLSYLAFSEAAVVVTRMHFYLAGGSSDDHLTSSLWKQLNRLWQWWVDRADDLFVVRSFNTLIVIIILCAMWCFIKPLMATQIPTATGERSDDGESES